MSSGRSSRSERAAADCAEDGLAEEDVHELGAVDLDVPGDEGAVHQVEQVVAVAALEQALELVGEGFLELDAPDRGGAGVSVGVRVDELALLGTGRYSRSYSVMSTRMLIVTWSWPPIMSLKYSWYL